MNKIKIVYRFVNGMCMVFDENGNQMSEYQGKWEEMKHKIIDNLSDDAEIKKTVEWKT